MKNEIVVFCLILLIGLTTEAEALPSKCLQVEERQSACPHILYKKAALAVRVLNVEKGDVICICLSDLKALKNAAASKVEQIQQKETLQRLAEKHQLTEQDIFTLIRN